MAKYFAKNEPNRYSLSGYFAAMLFTEGARRAGKNLTRETLVTALEGIKGFESGILPPVTIGADHETQRQGFWVHGREGPLQAADGLAQVGVTVALLGVEDLSITFGGLAALSGVSFEVRRRERSSR